MPRRPDLDLVRLGTRALWGLRASVRPEDLRWVLLGVHWSIKSA